MVCLCRLSNHPDLDEIFPIFLENPGSRKICDQNRKKNPDFDICSEIFK